MYTYILHQEKKNSDIKGERPKDHYERIDNDKTYTIFREHFKYREINRLAIKPDSLLKSTSNNLFKAG